MSGVVCLSWKSVINVVSIISVPLFENGALVEERKLDSSKQRKSSPQVMYAYTYFTGHRLVNSSAKSYVLFCFFKVRLKTD